MTWQVASVLYFCVDAMQHVDPMYQYSLQWFITLFHRSMVESPTPPDARDVPVRLGMLSTHFKFSIFKNVFTSLLQHLTSLLQHVTSLLQHVTSLVQHVTSLLQHVTSLVQHLTSLLQHLTSLLQHLTSLLQHVTSLLSCLQSLTLCSLLRCVDLSS